MSIRPIFAPVLSLALCAAGCDPEPAGTGDAESDLGDTGSGITGVFPGTDRDTGTGAGTGGDTGTLSHGDTDSLTATDTGQDAQTDTGDVADSASATDSDMGRGIDPYFETDGEADGMHPFVMPWADHSMGPTNLSHLNDADVLPLTIGADGHFYRNGEQYRLWGVNIACLSFPKSHEESDLIAERLAKFGFNAVRLHGFDLFYGWPNTRTLIDYSQATSDVFDEAVLDLFDYLVSALRSRGMYIDMNLLVGRRFVPGDSGDPGAPLPLDPITDGESWTDVSMQHDKTLGFFYDPILDAQKRYAQNLLTHVNPYTGLAYAEDPAVAIVEIVNEAGLMHYWMGGDLQQMSAPLIAELQAKWNAWLTAEYIDTAGVQGAWDTGTPATEILENTALTEPLDPWWLQVGEPAEATFSVEENADGTLPAMRIDIAAPGEESWHVQLLQQGLTLAPGERYTISFRARASSERPFTFDLRLDEEPWDAFTPWQERTLTTDWQTFTLGLSTGDDVAGANVRFEIAGVGFDTGTVWISSPSVVAGGTVLEPGETVESGTVPILERFGDRSWYRTAELDWLRFLRDTEAAYWQEMSRYLKEDVGIAAHVSGTQVMNSTPTLQATMDVVDTHNYWDHPIFPNESWDPLDWYIHNENPVWTPPGVMDVMVSGRVAGKPHIVSETNYVFPNDVSAEAPLTIAAYAALQDMDGIFLFPWDGQEASMITDYFDIAAHPHKLANLPMAAKMYRSFDVRPAETVWTVAMDSMTELQTMYDAGGAWRVADASLRGFPMAAAAIGRVEMDVSDGAVDDPFPDLSGLTTLLSDTGELEWNHTDGIITVNSAHTRALIGYTDGLAIGLGGPGVDCAAAPEACVVLAPGITLTGWSTLALSLIEGTSFFGDGRALLAATGQARNTGMIWTDDTRTSLGSQWGRPPSRVEVIPAAITLPRPAAEVRVFALDSRGQRIVALAVTGDTAASFEIGGGAGYPTLWYEVVLGADAAAGELSALLDQCAAYCAANETALAGCYPTATACLEDCANWSAQVRATPCDCGARADALLACAAGAPPETWVCGRLAEGIPPSQGCTDAYTDAFRCAANRSPCTDWAFELIDDFEDGDEETAGSAWGDWYAQMDEASTVTATLPDAHGAVGSFYAAHVSGEIAEWLNIRTTSAPEDLSDAVGIAFAAKGQGELRAALALEDMMAAENYDAHGVNFQLTSWWSHHTVRFDDPDFTQEGWGETAPFDPTQVHSLLFTPRISGPVELWIDDVVLLKAP
jgi:hypothetical protein